MIALEKLSAGYENQPVLRGISTVFASGKVTCILGKNGCGKSTLLRVMARLIRPQKGKVFLEGIPLEQYSQKELAKHVALLPQSRGVANITAEGLVMHGRYPYLGFPRHPSPADRDAVERAMERMGILEYRNKLLASLSGGERQKVYLAMALAQDAPVLLMDEPTTYLDIGRQFEILDTMTSLRESGKTVIAVLHDLSQALSVAEEICLLDGGEIVIHGAADDVFESGELDRVFGVRSRVITTPSGEKHHLFLRKKAGE